MGMKRKQIEATFDSIVDFAEVSQFIDTPVKFYSSGMYVRLGFAIAAHLDPDILLIDEILAVGDASFQAKCLNKIADLKGSGKTTLLVSHNLSNIKNHTQKVVWLDKGSMRAVGEPDQIVEKYLESLTLSSQESRMAPSFQGQQNPIQITGVRLLDNEGCVREMYASGEEAVLEIRYGIAAPVENPVFSVSFKDVQGQHVGGMATTLDGFDLGRVTAGGVLRFKLTPVLFFKGAYVVSVAIRDRKTEKLLDLRPDAAILVVGGPSVPIHSVSGHIWLPHQWEASGRESASSAIQIERMGA
jgi:ABC-type methionine transport system ATPase subunit